MVAGLVGSRVNSRKSVLMICDQYFGLSFEYNRKIYHGKHLMFTFEFLNSIRFCKGANRRMNLNIVKLHK